MTRFITGASVLLAAAALVVAVVALRDAHKPAPTPTYAEITAAGVRQFTDMGNRMTPPLVKSLLGEPTEVFRNNVAALCWRYESPYEIRMCWGPKRQRAWISTNIPGLQNS